MLYDQGPLFKGGEMPVLEVQATDRRKAGSLWLSRQAANVTSQDGEDGIIAEIFNIIQPRHKLCVEFGAHDGLSGSNSWQLIQRLGWNAMLIEADKTRFAELAARYANQPGVRTLNKQVELEGENRIDNLLGSADLPTPDMMVIDVDGMDWHIWSSMVCRPLVVVVEFNHTVPNDVLFIQDPNPSLNQGSSLRAFIELGRQKGYELVATTITNAFFVVGELFGDFKIDDNGIDSMYFNEAWWSWIFQGYDGTLFLAGNNKLIWKNMLAIDPEDIQPLPHHLRKMGG
jgi:hypothetical protein